MVEKQQRPLWWPAKWGQAEKRWQECALNQRRTQPGRPFVAVCVRTMAELLWTWRPLTACDPQGSGTSSLLGEFYNAEPKRKLQAVSCQRFIYDCVHHVWPWSCCRTPPTCEWEASTTNPWWNSGQGDWEGPLWQAQTWPPQRWQRWLWTRRGILGSLGGGLSVSVQ